MKGVEERHRTTLLTLDWVRRERDAVELRLLAERRKFSRIVATYWHREHWGKPKDDIILEQYAQARIVNAARREAEELMSRERGLMRKLQVQGALLSGIMENPRFAERDIPGP